MKTRKSNFKGSFFLVVVLLTGILVGINHELHNKKLALQKVNELVEVQKESEFKIENWMVDVAAWDKHERKFLEPIVLEAEVSEEDFSLVGNTFFNLLAEEPEEDIKFESWMLSSKKLLKRM